MGRRFRPHPFAIPPDTDLVTRPILIVQHKEHALSNAGQGMLELIEMRLHSTGKIRRDLPGDSAAVAR